MPAASKVAGSTARDCVKQNIIPLLSEQWDRSLKLLLKPWRTNVTPRVEGRHNVKQRACSRRDGNMPAIFELEAFFSRLGSDFASFWAPRLAQWPASHQGSWQILLETGFGQAGY